MAFVKKDDKFVYLMIGGQRYYVFKKESTTTGSTELILMDIGTGFNNTVYSIIQDSNGKYVIGGQFTSYTGSTANRIIRLNQDGSRDDTFNIGTGFNNIVQSIIQDSNSKYVIGGWFTTYSGSTANRIIRLNQDGSIDPDFITGTGFNTGTVLSIIQDSNGKYVIGGTFTSYNGGSTTNRIIRLNQDGSKDPDFITGTGFNNTVNSIIQDSNGKYVIGGWFTTYSGSTTNYIIRLNQDGSRDTSFNTGTGFDYGAVYSIIQDSNGKYVIGGWFTSYNGGSTTNGIIRLNQDGSRDDSFITGTGFNGVVLSIIQDSNGKYVCVGTFTTYSGVTYNRLIKLNTDGTPAMVV